MGYPNWFEQGAINYFKLILPRRFAGKPLIDFLQIGAYTGDATEWLMENIITDKTSWLTDVDTWCGSDEQPHKEFNWEELEKFYDERISKYTNVCKIKGYSANFLQNAQSQHYDFIYIDGSHEAKDCLTDAVMSWNLLQANGVMVFDDYAWDVVLGEIHRPRMAIDAFLAIFADALDVLFINHQVGVQKK